jgi:hypothetical protein
MIFVCGCLKKPYVKITVDFCRCRHLWPVRNLLGCLSRKIISVLVDKKKYLHRNKTGIKNIPTRELQIKTKLYV